jgi:hypothetical protein
MKRTTTLLLVASALLVAAPAFAQDPPPPPPAPAPPEPAALGDSLSGMAKADYVAARTLFNDGDAAGALVKFQSAYDASKDARLYWNIGACHKALRKYADAIRDLERYKQEAAASISEQDRKDADELIASLRTFVAALSVTTTPADAMIFVDDQPAGEAPMSRRLVDLGKHRIVAKKEGFVDLTQTIDVTGNADVVMNLQLPPAEHLGRLVVNASAGDSIFVDGKAMALGTWEGPVKTGDHVVRVTAPKKNAYESKVTVGDNETRTLQVTLESSGLPTWMWISAGAAGAVAITIVTVLLIGGSSDPGTVPPIPGTLQPGVVFLPSSFRTVR